MKARAVFGIVGLGGQLATAGGRRVWFRLALMAAGISVGVALLLAVASVEPATHASNAREAARHGIEAATLRKAPPDVTFTWWVSHVVDEQQLQLVVVQGRGHAPMPPGLTAIPASGQLLVSPALADALHGPDGPTLSAYLGGFRPSGTIRSDGLSDPSEWFAYLGRSPRVPVRTAQTTAVVQFEPRFADQGSMGLEAMIVVILGTVGLLLPIAVFVATATRLSAATREARYAAVRLAGATQRQLRGLIAVESGLAAAIGAGLGIVWFLIGRVILADIGFNGQRWYPADLWPGTRMLFLVVALVVGFSIWVSRLTMRRVEVSPLGVSRRAPRMPRRWVWVVALGMGSALLGLAAWRSDDIARIGGAAQFVLIGVGLALTGLGLAGTAGVVSWAFAVRVARRARSSAVLLAARRLESDPGATGRVVVSVVVLLALGGVAQAVMQSSSSGSQFRAPWALALPADAVVVTPFAESQSASNGLADAIARLDGVRSIETTPNLPTGGRRPHGATLVVHTDRSATVADAIRSVATWNAIVETPAEMRAATRAVPDPSGYGKLLVLAVFFLLIVCMATVLVSSVDWMSERRRSLAVLSAVGVPSGVLRTSVMLQIVVPLAFALMAGIAGALGITWLLFTTVQEPVVLAGRQLLVIAGVASGMVVVTTAATLPWLRSARDPELLRNE